MKQYSGLHGYAWAVVILQMFATEYTLVLKNMLYTQEDRRLSSTTGKVYSIVSAFEYLTFGI